MMPDIGTPPNIQTGRALPREAAQSRRNRNTMRTHAADMAEGARY